MSSFLSSSHDTVKVLHISFASDPTGSLGCTLVHCDKSQEDEMFLPGYALIGRLLEGETVARKYDVHLGDCIVAVNGQGFRRFAPDSEETETINEEGVLVQVALDNKVVSPGDAYDCLLLKIKTIKAAAPDPPLILTLERYGWDARPNAWGRFLAARDGNVTAALQLMQTHEIWKSGRFPIELASRGLQKLLREKAVSEIDVEFLHHDFPPTVYVDYGKLLALQTSGDISADDVVAAFVIFTERMLAKAKDPRHPKTCQFIDMSGVGLTTGMRADTLKKIYNVFEPNYPETLYKMVMYPVSTMFVSFVKIIARAVVVLGPTSR
jgi:CRAL/TRIO domain